MSVCHPDQNKNLPWHNSLETGPERLSLFGVPADGRLVSAAWTYYYPQTQFARLLGGATLPGYRNRGFYTALLARRVRVARQRGFRFLVADASPMSQPILEKHGFQCLDYSTRCWWSPPSLTTKEQQLEIV